MRTLFALTLFLLPFFPAQAQAAAPSPDKITTLNRMIDDPSRPPDCTGLGGREICTHTLYHYEIDEHGKLYFVKLTATAQRGENILQPGASNFSFICQLNSLLLCDVPAQGRQIYDLSAYAIDAEGVKVHSALSPWENPQKAAAFLDIFKNAPDAPGKSIDRNMLSQNRMMGDLVCYVFDFAALAKEYKRYGQLIEQTSLRKLDPDACLTSFQTICGDPGSRADEVTLAGDAVAGGHTKPPLTKTDVNRFCKSLKNIEAASLR